MNAYDIKKSFYEDTSLVWIETILETHARTISWKITNHWRVLTVFSSELFTFYLFLYVDFKN